MKIIKLFLSIIFAYFLILPLCNAQKITLKGGLNHQYFSEDIYSIEVPSYEWIRSAPQSSIYNLYEYTNELDRQAVYRFRYGGQLGANISIIDKKNWSFKSGLSIAYNSMSVRPFTILRRQIGSDLIRQIDVSLPNLENGDTGTVTSSTNCNVLTNTPNYDNFRPTKQVSFGYLTLPVTVEYHLVKNQISLFTDLLISTPIFTNTSRDRIYVDWVVENNQTVCTYRNSTESASDRDLWRDYTFGVNAGVKLWFGKYGIEASVGKYLQNIFVPHEEQVSVLESLDKLTGSPTQISLNFLYLLSHEKQSTKQWKEEPYFDDPQKKKKKRKKKKKAYTGAQNLWFSPTAFNLPKGTSKYRIIDIVNHSFEYGISDNFSMVGGLNGFPQVAGDLGYLFTSLRAKGSFDFSQFVHFGLSLGVTYRFAKDDENLRVINPSAILTLGEPENFFNLSYGYLFQTEIYEYGNSNDGFHMFSVGGSIKLGRYWSLISDNLMIIDQGYATDYITYLPSLGFKRNKGKNQFDIGLYYYIDKPSSDTAPIPIIGYTRFF